MVWYSILPSKKHEIANRTLRGNSGMEYQTTQMRQCSFTTALNENPTEPIWTAWSLRIATLRMEFNGILHPYTRSHFLNKPLINPPTRYHTHPLCIQHSHHLTPISHHSPSHNTNATTTPNTIAPPALPTTLPPTLGLGVGCAPPVPVAFAPPPVPPPLPPAPPVEDSDTAVSTAAEQGVTGASVRVTMSGAAGVDDGQVEHVIVESARAVSWRAVGVG